MPFVRPSFKVFSSILILCAGLLGVSYLQGRFDQGDKRKAIAAIVAKFPEVSGCEAEILSRFKGQALVRCNEKAWIVDVVRGTIMEEN